MIAFDIGQPKRLAIFCDTCGDCGAEAFRHPAHGEASIRANGWRIERTRSGRALHHCIRCLPARRVRARLASNRTRIAATALAVLCVGTPASAQRLGRGGTMVDGNTGLAHCTRAVGSVALVEEKRPATPEANLPPQLAAILALARAQNGGGQAVDPIPLLKLLAANSGCFQVVDRGEGFSALQREREIASAGQLKPGSNVGGSQLQSADYLLTAQLVYQDGNAGGGYGGLGGLAPGGGGLLGFRSKKLEAQALLTLVAVRTGVQVAVASGSARKRDIGVVGGGLAALGIGALGGGYTSADMGKITSAAFLDAYNKLVTAIPALQNPQAADGGAERPPIPAAVQPRQEPPR